MKATLYSHTRPLGTIDMKIIDESMGVVGGILTPNKDYFSLQPIFRRCLGTQNNEIENLKLNIQLENGCFLQPLGGFSILDLRETPNVISVEIPGSNYFNIFGKGEPTTFVEEPWAPLTIDAKLEFEKELNKEINLFREKKQFSNHPFAQNQFYAMARHTPDDDALFYAVSNTECQFAVIHLTWTGTPEKDPTFPTSQFYKSFDDFKKSWEE
ncbi:hypothetical protein DVR12_23760 [Chitinophaga silvatica]|uniref:Uncharacterized protein n=1 Tax=Chitinophaga silvatica TaxID=2282649 RepID=A0A3E1Y3L1_9BACT|nr:hypothetical protein [Chitinophaga silvatica]RFS19254.1 hypothetical protein DVR12_23760 [Chitinophaga silvatica]